MTSTAKILGFGLLAAVAGCGGTAENNPVNQGTECDLPSTAQCPGGFKQIKGAQAVGEADVSGGKLVGSGDCSFVCCGEGTSPQGNDCVSSESPEGPEGTPPEGIEGTEGSEGTGGVEGDAGTEGPEGGACTPDCIGKTCGDDGCGGECGSCDKLPEPVCLDEKTSLAYPPQTLPAVCDGDGKCKWETLPPKECTGFDTCMEGECICIPLTIKAACEDNKKDCGSIANECGGAVNCGQCTAPNTCGGGGTENVCGCPVCTAPETCGGGGKPGACGAPSGTVYWAKRFGGTADDEARGIAVDDSGNVFISGHFAGEVDFGGGLLTSAGGNDIFLAKYDVSGNHVWSKRFGGADEDRGHSVAVDAKGNVIVTGIFAGTVDFGGGPLAGAGGFDIFVAEYDASGIHQWSKRLGGAGDDRGYSVAMDGSGNVIVSGFFQATMDFGGGPVTSAGNFDIFVAMYDASGAHVWSKRYGGTGDDWGISIALDKDNNVALTGWFQETGDFGNGPQTSAGADDIVVAKFNAGGVLQWSRVMGGTGQDRGYKVDFDSEGNVVVAGEFYGTCDLGGGPLTSAGSADIYVMKLGAAGGGHIWSKSWGRSGHDVVDSIVIDSQGHVLITGTFQDSIDFGGGTLTSSGYYTGFVAKFDADGNHTWSKPFGSSGSNEGRAIAVDATLNVYVTGLLGGTTDLGTGPLPAMGGTDIFLMKLAE